PAPLLPLARSLRARRGLSPSSSTLPPPLCSAFQARKKLSETAARVALYPSLSQLAASLVHGTKHTVLLVNVYSNVIHENSSFLFSSTLCTEGLLSFYLTPSHHPTILLRLLLPLHLRPLHQLLPRPE